MKDEIRDKPGFSIPYGWKNLLKKALAILAVALVAAALQLLFLSPARPSPPDGKTSIGKLRAPEKEAALYGLPALGAFLPEN